MKRFPPPGFTLLELLITVVIGGLLVAIALPVLGKVRQNGSRVKCVANLRGIGLLVQRYAAENNGRFPPSRLQYRMDAAGQKRAVSFLPDLLNRLYLDINDTNTLHPIWWCPADLERPEGARKHSYGHHQFLGGDQATTLTWDLKPNPRYDARYASFQGVKSPLSEVIYLIEFVDRGDPKWSNAATGGRWPMVASANVDDPPAARIDFSRHAGVAHALMLDGSVRGFRVEDLLHTGYGFFTP